MKSIVALILLLQAPSRRKKFKEENPNLPLPPEPIITRWCSWLKAAEYYCHHFDEVKGVVMSFDSEDSEAIKSAQELFNNFRIKSDLAYIKTHFASLVAATLKLETQGLDLNESISTMTSIRNSLGSMDEKSFSNKMEAVLKRNPGFEIISDINNVLSKRAQPEKPFVKNLSPKEVALYRYCPTTSTDVERSFSTYKNHLTDKRKSFLFENLKKHCIVHCNRQNE